MRCLLVLTFAATASAWFRGTRDDGAAEPLCSNKRSDDWCEKRVSSKKGEELCTKKGFKKKCAKTCDACPPCENKRDDDFCARKVAKNKCNKKGVQKKCYKACNLDACPVVGCDGVAGSGKVVDNCGVCGGDGDCFTCKWNTES